MEITSWVSTIVAKSWVLTKIIGNTWWKAINNIAKTISSITAKINMDKPTVRNIT